MMRSDRLGTQLRELDVSGTRGLGDAGTETLASALPPTLESFAFASVGCGDAGMTAAARALSGTAVRMVVCNDNSAGTKGWAALGTALPSQERGDALRLRQDLGCLDEDFCCLDGELGTAGMTALAAALAESSLTLLVIVGCRDVDVAGYRALAAALPRSNLRGLSFTQCEGNEISAEARATLQAAAAQIPGFEVAFVKDEDEDE